MIWKRINYWNSFQTVLMASLKPSGSGTELRGIFGLHPFVKVSMFVWFGGVALIGGLFFIITLTSVFTKETSIGIGTISELLVVPVMVLFGIGLLLLGKYIGRDEVAFLKAFLVEVLDAKEIEDFEQSTIKDR